MATQNRISILTSTTALSRPTGVTGELYWNSVDKAFGILDAGGVPFDLNDHGNLLGLGDDDHPQYHTDARGDARYVNLTGDTMTGPLILNDKPANPVDPNAAASANYVGVTLWDQGYAYAFDDGVWFEGTVYHCVSATVAAGTAFSTDDWRPVAASVGTALQLQYQWTTSVAGQVPSGHYGVNNADPTLATMVRVSNATNLGFSTDTIWQATDDGDTLIYQENTGGAEWNVYVASGPAVLVVAAPNYYEIPAAYLGSVGVPEDNRIGTVSLISNPESKLPAGGVTGDRLIKQSASIYDAAWQKSDRVLSRELFDADVTYQEHDMVRSDGYMAVARTTTTENPAPIPSGPRQHDLPDAPTWGQQNFTGAVQTGHEYEFLQAGWVHTLGVWAPEITVDNSYSVRVFDVTDPNNIQAVSVPSPILIEGQWSVVLAQSGVVTVGVKWLVIMDALNSGGSSQVTGGWLRQANAQSGAPAAQSWIVDNQDTNLRIDNVDLDTVDRNTELNGIIAGSTIQFVETVNATNSVTYYVNSVTDNVTYVTYSVTLENVGVGGRPVVGQATTMTADVPVPQSTKYEQIVDYWLANTPAWATITGQASLGGVDQVVPNNAYGVRLEFEPAYVSPDWFLYSSTETTAGGGGTPVSTLTGLTDTPDDYLGSANKVLAVNAGETAVEFITNTAGVTTFAALSDTPSSYVGQANKNVFVNAGEDALEFRPEQDLSLYLPLAGTSASPMTGNLFIETGGKASATISHIYLGGYKDVDAAARLLFLTVGGDTTNQAYIERAAGTDGTLHFVQDEGTGDFRFYHNGTGDFDWWMNSVNVMVLEGDGTLSVNPTGVASGAVVLGAGTGGVALTVNDGGGNANVTFNHRDRIPDQAGSSARIASTVDSTTAALDFILGDNVTAGVVASATSFMKVTTAEVTVKTDLRISGTAPEPSLLIENTAAIAPWEFYQGTGSVLNIRYDGTIHYTLQLNGLMTGNSSVASRVGGDARWQQSSSLRYKDNVEGHIPSRGILDALQVRTWIWSKDIAKTDERYGQVGMGLISEEVSEVLPEAVTYRWKTKRVERADGSFEDVDTATRVIQGLDPMPFIGLLIEEVRELKQRIDELENR